MSAAYDIHVFLLIEVVANYRHSLSKSETFEQRGDFEEQRNIYTHGTLKLRRPDETFVIEYVENRRLKAYAELNIEVLTSNLQTSNELRSVLSAIRTTFQKKPTAQ
jgi:hypothetical protein